MANTLAHVHRLLFPDTNYMKEIGTTALFARVRDALHHENRGVFVDLIGGSVVSVEPLPDHYGYHRMQLYALPERDPTTTRPYTATPWCVVSTLQSVNEPMHSKQVMRLLLRWMAKGYVAQVRLEGNDSGTWVYEHRRGLNF